MAAPNILNTNTVTGKTVVVTINSSNSDASVAVNAASSNKVFRINLLQVVNNSATACTVTAKLYGAASGGTATLLSTKDLSVAANTRVTILDRNTSLWLEEDRRITLQASVASVAECICSYEEIS